MTYRIAHAMIADAEPNGELDPGATIIEPAPGNPGVGLARGVAGHRSQRGPHILLFQ